MTPYFDTHAHFSTNKAEVQQVLKQALDANVCRILAVGGSDSLNAGAKLAYSLAPEQCLLSLGFDRDSAAEIVSEENVRQILNPESAKNISAIGELGLDYAVSESPRESQIKAMELQLTIAAEMEKPIIIHTRNADEDTLAILRNARSNKWFAGDRPGVIHCFTGSQAFAEQLLELGYYISFSGIVSFANASDLRATSRTIPEDKILIETDSPYLAPVPKRGKRNEPAFVVHVAECLAKQRDVTADYIRDITTNNANRLFGLG